MKTPEILHGIRLCEENHAHDTLCRHACDICDTLYPPSSLIEGVCAPCWREFTDDTHFSADDDVARDAR